jgi:hypothetical protein
MKLVCLTSAVLLAAAAALAQEQSVAISVTTIDGHPMVSVRNLNTLPLEAFLLEVSSAETNQPTIHMSYDVHANFKHDTPISPGSSTELPLPVLTVTQPGNASLPIGAPKVYAPVLCAVIFLDGSTWGDGACIQDLLSRRKALAASLQDVMGLLQRIADQGLDREQALTTLQQAWKERKHANAVDDQARANDQIFYGVTTTIQHQPRNDGASTDFPRIARILRKSYATWLADLKAAKPTKARFEKSL